MKKEDEFVTDKHLKTRGILRVIGPLLLGVGIILVIISIVDFFGGMGFGGHHMEFGGSGMGMHVRGDKFWMFFLAMPFIIAGAALTNMGYGSVLARYEAREYSPVAKDTINYIAKESAPAIKDVSNALREGQENMEACVKCAGENKVAAKFCNHCGEHLQKTCLSCEKVNPVDAKFCNECGRTF